MVDYGVKGKVSEVRCVDKKTKVNKESTVCKESKVSKVSEAEECEGILRKAKEGQGRLHEVE